DLHHEPAYDTPAAVPAGLINGHDADGMTALQRTQSAVWPLVLALGVGIAIGFAGGFFAGSRERTPAPAVTAGREFTEAAVAAAPAKSEEKSQKSEPDASKVETPKPSTQPLKS